MDKQLTAESRAKGSISYPWGVTADRLALALYLRWEYGHSAAVARLRERYREFRFGVVAYFRSRREAEQFRRRLVTAANHQRGRLGLPTNDCACFVRRGQ